MPKIGMGPVRKRAFVKAAIQSIHDKGFASMTMADVAREAGVSTGLIHHYLGSKDHLLSETMRFLLADLLKVVQEKLAEADSPRARLDAIVDSCFSEAQMHPETVSAWLAFYVQAQRSEDLSKLLRIYSRRLQSNLASSYRAFLPTDKARMAAISTAALIDGFWLKSVLVETVVDHRQAVRILKTHIAQQIGEQPS